ncbi:MAG: hypothetical protein CSA95_01135 [Bacteroidetes bacterium]|nr:MAG: hypothetical protein CSA95_01135 [Bacteroidota bacterium]
MGGFQHWRNGGDPETHCGEHQKERRRVMIPTLVNYLYEASLTLGILYLPFFWVGRRNSFHGTNRIILLFSLLLSLLLPLLHLPMMGHTASEKVALLQEVIITPERRIAEAQEYSVMTLLTMGYLLLSLLFLLAAIVQNLSPFLKYRGAQRLKREGYTLILTTQKCSPFSLFRFIFIHKEQYRTKSGKLIIEHERAHIKLGHHWDKLFMELMRIALWFHPMIYLFRHSLNAIHEYQADRRAVQHTDRSKYLRLLYSETLRLQGVSMANQFSYPSLKKRVQMLINKPTKKQKGIYYFVWIPVIAGLLFLLGTQRGYSVVAEDDSRVSVKSEAIISPPEENNQKKEEKVYDQVDQLPLYKGGDKARIQFLIDNLRYPKDAVKDSIQGVVFVQFIVEKDGTMSNFHILKGVSESLDKEALRVVRKMPAWIPGKHEGKPVRVKYNLPIRFTL